MKESGVLLLFFSLFFHVNAQEKPDPNSFLHPLHPSMTSIIAMFSVLFSLTFLLLAYARFCQDSTNPDDAFIDNTEVLVRARPRYSGIDKTAIESLPFFKFSSLKGLKEGLECAVCLSKFDDSDVLRLLPRCKHAFHMNCIDQWLESHSSCPICRNRFDSTDLKRTSYSNSLRLLKNPSNLSEGSNLELFVRRQQDFKAESSEELLIQEENGKILHKFMHKIIVTDVVMKNRWSDVNPSDFLSLSTEMLRVMSTNRFTNSESSSRRFHDQQIEKIKQDIGRKRMFESKFRNNPASSSSNEPNSSTVIAIDPAEKRSMSEITVFSRHREFSVKSRTSSDCNSGNEETIRSIWLPMVRRTVQWFFGGERKLQTSENTGHNLTV